MINFLPNACFLRFLHGYSLDKILIWRWINFATIWKCNSFFALKSFENQTKNVFFWNKIINILTFSRFCTDVVSSSIFCSFDEIIFFVDWEIFLCTLLLKNFHVRLLDLNGYCKFHFLIHIKTLIKIWFKLMEISKISRKYP